MPHDAVTRLEAVEGVEAAAPYLEQMVVVSASGRRTTVTLRGVDSTYISVAPLDEYMVRGEYRLLGERDTATMRRRDVLVAGYGVAAELGMPRLDGDVELYAVNRRQFSSLLPAAGISRLRAALGGVFMVNADIDRRYVLCDLDAACSTTPAASRTWRCVLAREPTGSVSAAGSRRSSARDTTSERATRRTTRS